jgi:DnaJ-class molecular chaperone
MATCATCNGLKQVILSAEKSPLGIKAEVTCPTCKGTGETGNPNACPTCNGSKTTTRPMTLSSGGSMKIEVDCPDCVPQKNVI